MTFQRNLAGHDWPQPLSRSEKKLFLSAIDPWAPWCSPPLFTTTVPTSTHSVITYLAIW